MSRPVRLVGLLVLGGCSSSVVQPPGGQKVRACLDDLAAARGDWSGFSVSHYDLDGPKLDRGRTALTEIIALANVTAYAR